MPNEAGREWYCLPVVERVMVALTLDGVWSSRRRGRRRREVDFVIACCSVFLWTFVAALMVV
jgi:hypothetical protein